MAKSVTLKTRGPRVHAFRRFSLEMRQFPPGVLTWRRHPVNIKSVVSIKNTDEGLDLVPRKLSAAPQMRSGSVNMEIFAVHKAFEGNTVVKWLAMSPCSREVIASIPNVLPCRVPTPPPH